MSQWSHVVGSMSLDYMPAVFGGRRVEDLKGIIGSWKNPYHDEDDGSGSIEMEGGTYGSGPKMPGGSEGPLMYNVQTIGSSHSMNNGLVTFWANLRDFGEEEIEDEIIPYFENLLKRLMEAKCTVRNMAIQVECEGGKSRLLTNGPDNTLRVIDDVLDPVGAED